MTLQELKDLGISEQVQPIYEDVMSKGDSPNEERCYDFAYAYYLLKSSIENAEIEYAAFEDITESCDILITSEFVMIEDKESFFKAIKLADATEVIPYDNKKVGFNLSYYGFKGGV